MSEALTLPALAQKLDAAVARALESRKGDDEQKAYLRITQKMREHELSLAHARFLLTSASLELDERERATLMEAIASLRHATTRARELMQSNPAELRQGPAWKALDQAATSLRNHIAPVGASASKRFVDQQQVPARTVGTLLVEGDSLRLRYRRAWEHYEGLPQQFGSEQDIARFVDAVNALRDIARQIEDRAAPPEHRAQWARLVRGALTLATIEPAFMQWLNETGRAEQVALNLTDS